MSPSCHLFFPLIFYLCGTVTALRDFADEACTSATSCSDCIRRKPSCAWCDSNTFTDARCDNHDNLMANGCESISNPEATLILLKDDDLSDAVYENEDDTEPTLNAIQVKPQRVKLRIRQGDTQRIQVKVRQASDYPVDLYYLMDLSYSMSDDLENLKLLGNELPRTMRSLTRSFRLGFGSFVDKPVMPYILEIPGSNAGPCEECEKTYSFRNVLSLTENATLFQERLLKTNISGNLDIAEGTLDAVMQVTVCQSHIGWRRKARKLLVVTTDAPFHVQGDGKLAGIIKPNDGLCHLDNNHEYPLSHIYDYPSIAHLDRRMSEHNIISIFAVTNKNYRLYERVSQMIRGSTAAVLYGDSRNIIEIINTKYSEISSNIEMIHNAPGNLRLSFTANCSDGSSTKGENKCRNFHVRDEVSFDIDITAISCCTELEKTQSFHIYPIGYDEKLTVEVEVVCNCSCDSNQETNSSSCGGHGTLVCGECFCEEGRFGRFCECSADTADKVDTSKCRPNNFTETLCAGRGDCFCGRCICHQSELKNEIYSGTYCECNNKACPMFDEEVCGGSDRGECVCGKDGRTSICECRPGFSGKNCGCPTQTETCLAGNGFLCNLLGECECGRCKCNSTRFFGPRCDDCASCTECDLHKNCIKCEILESDNFEDGFTREKCNLCTEIIWTVTKLPSVNDSFQECTLEVNDKCRVPFLIGRFEDHVTIYVKAEPDCPVVPTQGRRFLYIYLFIILAILFFGLIVLLLYRVYVWYSDRNEYMEFEKETETVAWEEYSNPLFKPTTSTFINPMYGREAAT